MLGKIKSIDAYARNIILVFLGTSLANFLNLLYQLLAAHKLSPADFAALNTQLSIFMLISLPLVYLQTAVAKYAAEFNSQNQPRKIKGLLSSLLKINSLLAFIMFLAFYFSTPFINDKLRLPSHYSGYMLACLIAIACITPVFTGGLQGLELFLWLMAALVISGLLKLALAYVFISWGFNIVGALGALLIANLLGLVISFLPLRRYLSLGPLKDKVQLKEFFLYLLPVTVSTFCFVALSSSDMILVRYFFASQDSGLYSLAQMAGKIFLFLPFAISFVMFPRTSGLKARNLDTRSILGKSLGLAAALGIISVLGYNLFPETVLRILTGKTFSESVFLGRLFSISMSFFALIYILILYFLSVRDLRFLKYLVLFTFLQLAAILVLHQNLTQVQLVLCTNSIILFIIHLILVYRKRAV